VIAADPANKTSKILAHLVLCLESESSFSLSSLSSLYKLDIESFELATSISSEWRIDRYYVGKAIFFDLSHQIDRLSNPRASAAPLPR